MEVDGESRNALAPADLHIAAPDPIAATPDFPGAATVLPVANSDLPFTATDLPVANPDPIAAIPDLSGAATVLPVANSDLPVIATDFPVANPDSSGAATDSPVAIPDLPVTASDLPLIDGLSTTSDLPIAPRTPPGPGSPADFLRDLRAHHNVPGRCRSGPQLVDEGRSYVSLAWEPPEEHGGSSLLLYRLEIWEAASWKEVAVTNRAEADIWNLDEGVGRRARVSAGNCFGWGEPVESVLDVPKTWRSLPRFTQTLPGQLALPLGKPVSLTCQAEGYPEPRLEWYKNGEELGVSGSRLELQELTAGGLYSCEAKNSLGRISTHTYVTALAPGQSPPDKHQIRLMPPEGEHGPEIRLPLRAREVEPGELVRLTLEVVGEPRPALHWHKDGHLLQAGEFRTFSEGDFHTLEFIATVGSDGVYTARAVGLGVAVSSAEVKLKGGSGGTSPTPAFHLPLEPEVRVWQGEDLRLTARLAPRLRRATVTWSRDGVRLMQSRDCVMSHSASGEISLELGRVRARSAGLYTCTVSTKGGLSASSSCRLEVLLLKEEMSARSTAASTKLPPHLSSP